MCRARWPASDETDAAESSAVQLFAAVARRASPEFDQDLERAPLARIARQLDGIPLAIELAAAGVRLMTVSEIEAELTRGMDILSTSARNMPHQHRCMVTVFDQSWGRLDDRERAVFARLSVFAGGFRAEAAAEVAGASRADLARLLDTSWLRRDSRTGRYTIHELARQFGADHLTAAEAEETRQRHTRAFAGFLAVQWPDLQGSRYLEATRAIEADFDNVRVAWRHASDSLDSQALATALPAFWFFFDSGSRFREGAALLAHAVAQVRGAGPALEPLLGRLLARLGALHFSLDDYGKSEALLRESLVLLHAHDQRADLAFADLELGMTLLFSRETDAEAIPFMQSARDRYRALADRWGEAYAEYWLGITWMFQYAANQDAGVLANAEACVRASERAFRELGNAWGMAGVYTALSSLADSHHNSRTAWEMASRGRDLFAEARVIWGVSSALQMMADAAWRLGWIDQVRQVTLEGLRLELEYRLFNHALQLAQMAARLRLNAGDTLGALEVLGAVDAERRRLGRPRDPVVLPLLDQLDESHTPPQSAAIERGRARSFEDVLRELIAELAQSTPESAQDGETSPAYAANESLDEPLTERELEILALVADGLSNRDIAETLVLSVGTVKAHIHNLTGKLGANNRTEAVAIARRLGLIGTVAG